ncbi:MAG: hypothetical protein NT093_00170 [Candidatus Moranbacteria bacterium]|nr:hypothetical protein [Candidatus Moranbacteria bacterium]
MIEFIPVIKPVQEKISPEEISEALEFYRQNRDALIRSAALCRDTAYSYREIPFKVGCALLVVSPDSPQGEYNVFQAHNFTPSKKDRKGWEKRCAERNAVHAAIERNTKFIVAIVTVSKESDTGDGNKSENNVLHLCRECRDMLRELLKKGVLREESIICNVNDANDSNARRSLVIEERTAKEYLELYKDDEEGAEHHDDS